MFGKQKQQNKQTVVLGATSNPSEAVSEAKTTASQDQSTEQKSEEVKTVEIKDYAFIKAFSMVAPGVYHYTLESDLTLRPGFVEIQEAN